MTFLKKRDAEDQPKQQQYFKNKYDWYRGGISEQIESVKYNLSRNEKFTLSMNYKPSQINVSGSNFSKLYQN